MKPFDNALFSYRRLNLLGLFISGSALIYASLELERFLGSINCMLCTSVRLSLLCMTVIFLLAFLHNPWKAGQRFYSFFNTIIASLGLAAAGRYVWLESTTATECSIGIEQSSPLSQLITPLHQVIGNGTECLPPSSTLLGLSIPQVALGVMVILFVICWRVLTRAPKARNIF